MEEKRLKMKENTVGELNAESDFCDLDPTKICDNCCKCLELEKRKYNSVEVEFADRIDAFETIALPFDEGDFAEQEEEACGENSFDPSRVQPIKIDPMLVAEWEAKLAALEKEERERQEREDAEYDQKEAEDGCGCGDEHHHDCDCGCEEEEPHHHDCDCGCHAEHEDGGHHKHGTHLK